MTDTTQAVVDTSNAAAMPAATETNAQTNVDDLDSLLAEFDQSTARGPAASPPDPQQTQQTQPVISEDRVRRIEDRIFQDDLNSTIKNIVGDLKIPDRFAKGWIDQIARENPTVANAFLNRSSDPKAWKRIETALSKEISKDFKALTPVDEGATVDRAAVTAAVRGASTKAATETEPSYGSMSSRDGRKHVKEKYGFDPGW